MSERMAFWIMFLGALAGGFLASVLFTLVLWMMGIVS